MQSKSLLSWSHGDLASHVDTIQDSNISINDVVLSPHISYMFGVTHKSFLVLVLWDLASHVDPIQE